MPPYVLIRNCESRKRCITAVIMVTSNDIPPVARGFVRWWKTYKGIGSLVMLPKSSLSYQHPLFMNTQANASQGIRRA